MALDRAPHGTFVGQDQHPAHGRRLPPEPLARNLACQAALGVKRTQRPLDGAKLRLDLGDDQGPRPGLPRQQVDRAALAVLGKGDLRLDKPTPRDEKLPHPANNHGMDLVKEAVGGGAVI